MIYIFLVDIKKSDQRTLDHERKVKIGRVCKRYVSFVGHLL